MLALTEEDGPLRETEKGVIGLPRKHCHRTTTQNSFSISEVLRVINAKGEHHTLLLVLDICTVYYASCKNSSNTWSLNDLNVFLGQTHKMSCEILSPKCNVLSWKRIVCPSGEIIHLFFKGEPSEFSSSNSIWNFICNKRFNKHSYGALNQNIGATNSVPFKKTAQATNLLLPLSLILSLFSRETY